MLNCEYKRTPIYILYLLFSFLCIKNNSYKMIQSGNGIGNGSEPENLTALYEWQRKRIHERDGV